MEKVIKVIESCTSLEQIESAKRYQFLYLDNIGWDQESVIALRGILLDQITKIITR